MSLDKFIERELEATGYWKNYPERFKEITVDPPTWHKVITALKEAKEIIEIHFGQESELLKKWDKEFAE